MITLVSTSLVSNVYAMHSSPHTRARAVPRHGPGRRNRIVSLSESAVPDTPNLQLNSTLSRAHAHSEVTSAGRKGTKLTGTTLINGATGEQPVRDCLWVGSLTDGWFSFRRT